MNDSETFVAGIEKIWMSDRDDGAEGDQEMLAVPWPRYSVRNIGFVEMSRLNCIFASQRGG